MFTVLIIIFSLSALIFCHEAFHFLVAKLSGVIVEEFGFGIPPRIFGFRFRGTLYSLNIIPFGGFVRLAGSSSEVLGFGEAGSFATKSFWRRAAITVAGPLGNFLLAVSFFAVLFAVGNPTWKDFVVVDEVVPGSPAALGGITPGDHIVGTESTEIGNYQELKDFATAYAGEVVTLMIRSAGEEESHPVQLLSRPVSVIRQPAEAEGEGAFGVGVHDSGEIIYPKVPWHRAIGKGFQEAVMTAGLLVSGFREIFREAITKVAVPEELVGIVGIYSVASTALGLGVRIFIQFLAVISLNLAIFNLLPIPALDGGRLVFSVLETIFPSERSAKLEQWVNAGGMAFLLLLFAVVTVRDVMQLL